MNSFPDHKAMPRSIEIKTLLPPTQEEARTRNHTTHSHSGRKIRVRARARPPRARAPLHLRCPSLLAVLYYGVRDLTQRIHDRIPLIEWHRDALPFEFRACVVLEMRGELREELSLIHI